ncbi:MAG: 23S rRNA (guanosine(2251)-2'-O)-methyltransferase RlmB [Candidatus Marinimicrobia bacterium]|nr:23S rRNA (guanosine(2251)-2'-O)-methyltransferase RlmB [Candidatus Neomarinimicrobiota bacterium]
MEKSRSKPKVRDEIHQIFGINGILPVLKSDKYQIQAIDILENSPVTSNVEIKELLKNYTSHTHYVNHDTFYRKYGDKRTQGIVVSLSGELVQTLPSFLDIEKNYCLLIVDNVTDPQNFGQIIRTAECAGVDGIIIPERNSVGMTDTVLQVSQGAFCNIPIYSVINLNQTLGQLKKDDFWSIAIENGIDAKSWDQIDYKGKVAIVVGSEGQGIKQLVLKSCDFQATIPMQGEIPSLNVSAATAVVLFERLRQIIFKSV